jgi:hypothetical protein
MKKLLIATAIALTTLASTSIASPMLDSSPKPQNQILIHSPDQQIQGLKELACYGCLSSQTGRPRTNYVRPHTRSNGSYVQG